MSTRETTKDLQSILEQQSSIDAGLHTEKDVIRYINRICVSLEEVGYVPPDTFTIERFLRAIEEEVLPELLLSEEDDKKPGFLSRAVSAVKGALARKVTPAHVELRRHHAAKATAALDTVQHPNSTPAEVHKASKAYVKHYVKATALAKKVNPEAHARLSGEKAAAKDPAHGSRADAEANLGYAKKIAPVVNAKSAALKDAAKMAADAKAQRAAANAAPRDGTDAGVVPSGVHPAHAIANPEEA